MPALVATGADPDDVGATWDDCAGFLEALEASRPAINVATLAGHGSFRQAVMGRDPAPPSDEQLAEMCALVEEAMEAGALGLSTGLIYAPGFHAETPELIALASVMAGRLQSNSVSRLTDS